MVIPSLSMHSVSCSLQRRSGNRPRLVVYLEVSYTLQQQHFHPQCSIIIIIIIAIIYLKRKHKWPICGRKIPCLIPNLKFNRVVIQTLQTSEKAHVWMYTVLCWRCYALRRQCGHLTLLSRPAGMHKPTALWHIFRKTRPSST